MKSQFKSALVVLGVVLLLFTAVGAIGLFLLSHKEITAIEVDESSAWFGDFAATTGYTFVRIEGKAKAGGRIFFDHFTIVGRRRELKWFEQYGFAANESDKSYSIHDIFETGAFSGMKTTSVLMMTNAQFETATFCYFPETGVLMCSG